MFDIVLGVIAGLVVVRSVGNTRSVALFILLLCVGWVPWDLVIERRRVAVVGR